MTNVANRMSWLGQMLRLVQNIIL